jgi:hypothetical protein
VKSTALSCAHLDQRTAAEIDAEIEAVEREEEHCKHERDGRITLNVAVRMNGCHG